MKTLGGTLPAAFILVTLAAGFTGCATYSNTRQENSASIRGTHQGASAAFKSRSVPLPGQWPAVVYPFQIDGFTIAAANPDSVRFLPPGEHQITLWAAGNAGPYEGTVTVVLVANHNYQFITTDGINASLLDETDGVDKSVAVGSWELFYQPYPDDEPLVVEDITGADYARPPFHPGGQGAHSPPERPVGPGGGDNHHPPPTPPGGPGGGDHHAPPATHSGGPPSIPHDPRPSPAGGGGHDTGSSHSSSGGGSYSSSSSSGGDHKK